MSCPICHETIENACVGGICMHHFCYMCLFQWCAKNNIDGTTPTGCPVCRKPIFDIRFDREFDIILHGNDFPTFKHPHEIIVSFPKGSKAGVTIKTNKGPGVEVIYVNENDQFIKLVSEKVI